MTDLPSARSKRTLLSHPMRDMLWTIAQHKYGWAHVSRLRGQQQVAEALERRGLVVYTRDHSPTVAASQLGAAEIERRWPISPFALGTYNHQPQGWDPKEGRRVA